VLELVSRIAARYSTLFARTVDPATEVTISVGASEGLFACLQALLNPGDEAVILLPAFDLYTAQTTCVWPRARHLDPFRDLRHASPRAPPPPF
jgi:aspartate/methionine/tyrosine aminotransferase